MFLLSKWIELNNEIIRRNDDGTLKLEKDKEAVKSYFVDYINVNMRWFHSLEEKINYLIKNDYYEKELFDKYSWEDVKEFYKYAYSFKFRFKSYMAAKKFYDSYALKSDDGKVFLERYEDRLVVVAMFSANGNVDDVYKHIESLINQVYVPATPTLLNAGRKRSGDKVSCFLIDIPDSTEGISYGLEAAAQLSRRGGGVGINLTDIRARGEMIKGIHDAASGVIGVAKLMEGTFSHYNQLNQRAGAGVAYLSALHADIFEFLSTRGINVDETKRLKTLSIGTIIPNIVMEKARKGEHYYAFYPHNLKQVTGKDLSEINMKEEYESLINNKEIKKKKIDAREFLTEVAKIQLESGFPYLIFIDNANDVNHLRELAPIRMSNLCVEVFQPQTKSIIRNRSQQSDWGYDISCNLGSLVMDNLFERNKIEQDIEYAIRALNRVVDTTSIDAVPTVKKANDNIRSVGLGLMGFHGWLAKNSIAYESEEAKEVANISGMILRYYSLKASNKVAIETQPYPDFKKSEYSKGKGLEIYTKEEYVPTLDKVKEIFKDVYIPTKDDWTNLIESIKEHGVANGFVNALAPTGNISYVVNATPTILPVVEQVEARHYSNSTTYYPMPHLSPTTMWYYKRAYDMDMLNVIDVIAEFQKHIDQGISSTMFVNSTTSTKDLVKIYMYAQLKGLKSLYYTRTNNTKTEDCISCAV